MKLKLISLPIVVLFLSNIAIASDSLQALKVASGHYIAFEKHEVSNLEAPTLILLPGINRALDSRDEFIQILKRQRTFNFVTLHSSLHPESVQLIPASETPYFQLGDVSAVDLANEVLVLVKKLKIKNPVFVSLSYSSLISSELAKLTKSGFIIEAAPMIRYDESDLSGSQTVTFWKNWFNAFPVVGGAWSNAFLKQTYGRYWAAKVDQQLEEMDPALSARRSHFIQGYTQLSLAADGFDYREQNLKVGLKRYFILAEMEEPTRAEFQSDAILQYQNERQVSDNVFVIKDSGHIIPSDEPKQYIETLRKILKLEALLN